MFLFTFLYILYKHLAPLLGIFLYVDLRYLMAANLAQIDGIYLQSSTTIHQHILHFIKLLNDNHDMQACKTGCWCNLVLRPGHTNYNQFFHFCSKYMKQATNKLKNKSFGKGRNEVFGEIRPEPLSTNAYSVWPFDLVNSVTAFYTKLCLSKTSHLMWQE